MATETNRLPQLGGTERPLLAGGVIMFAGLEIVFLNWRMAMELLFVTGMFTSVGLILGTLIALTGGMVVAFPHLAKPLGVVAISLSVLALLGALGGLLFGTIFGIVGGSLALAWQPASESQWEADQATRSPKDSDFGWQEDQSSPVGGGGPDLDMSTGGSGEGDFGWQDDTGAGATTSPVESEWDGPEDVTTSETPDDPSTGTSSPMESDDDDDVDDFSWQEDR